jgi:hypothetical protein
MSTFGFYPGPIDYWMLLTDWRNGSIAIMLAIGALVVGYAVRTESPFQPPASPPMPALLSARLIWATPGKIRAPAPGRKIAH